MKSRRGSKAADQLRRAWAAPKAEQSKRKGEHDRATFHLAAELLDEMRNTVVALSGPPYRMTMSKLATGALRRELDRLRRGRGGKDQGEAFGHRAAEVTRGRPIR